MDSLDTKTNKAHGDACGKGRGHSHPGSGMPSGKGQAQRATPTLGQALSTPGGQSPPRAAQPPGQAVGAQGGSQGPGIVGTRGVPCCRLLQVLAPGLAPNFNQPLPHAAGVHSVKTLCSQSREGVPESALIHLTTEMWRQSRKGIAF